MKKICSILLIVLFLLVGCGKYGEDDIVKDLDKKINKLKSYRAYGKLDIINNDETYHYDIDVSYKKDNYYKVSLKNIDNNHTQIILKNNDSVYVLTPSLNKSFKFQSDWPYSNSQIYLLKSLVDDIKNDKNRKFKNIDDGYQFITTVNYPNNRNLVNQKIDIDKKLNIKDVKVYNKDSSVAMEMKFTKIDYSPTFKKNYFNLNSVMKSYSVTEDDDQKTSKLDDSIYPLVIPSGTKLTSEEKLKKDTGERIIMTFEGEKPFLLVEETAKVEDDFTIVPTYGEPYRLMDTLGVMTDNSLTWTSNGIEYYIVSDVLNKNELVEVAQSINLVQTMK